MGEKWRKPQGENVAHRYHRRVDILPPDVPPVIGTKRGSYNLSYSVERNLSPLWGVFAKVSKADANPNPHDFSFQIGAAGKALFRGRDGRVELGFNGRQENFNPMFWMTLCFIASYILAFFFFALLQSLWVKPSRWRNAALIAIVIAPIFPYLSVAAQTALFGDYLRPYVLQAMKDTGMMGENPLLMKVFYITPFEAKVYIVDGEWDRGGVGQARAGDILLLKRTMAGWKLAEWDTVWSSVGSADGNTFPPYPEGG